MLHHYNYSTSLSHFLSYHQLDDQQIGDNEQQGNTLCEDLSQQDDIRCRSNSSANNNKSFTIAAILGLKNDKIQNDSGGGGDLNVVNLSVHSNGANRSLVSNLQLPGRQPIPAGHYSVGPGCPQRPPG